MGEILLITQSILRPVKLLSLCQLLVANADKAADIFAHSLVHQHTKIMRALNKFKFTG